VLVGIVRRLQRFMRKDRTPPARLTFEPGRSLNLRLCTRTLGVPGSRLPWIAFSYSPSVFSPVVVLLAFVTALQLASCALHREGIDSSLLHEPCDSLPRYPVPLPCLWWQFAVCHNNGLAQGSAPLPSCGEWGDTRRVFPGPAAPAFAFTPLPWEGLPLLLALKTGRYNGGSGGLENRACTGRNKREWGQEVTLPLALYAPPWACALIMVKLP
jgi:hypothetical protein